MKIDPVDFLPSIHLVQNGYVSIIAYQTRGYAYLPWTKKTDRRQGRSF